VDGFCVPKNRECTKDDECKGEKVCASNYTCVDKNEIECDASHPCPNKGEECIQGACVDAQLQALCSQMGGTVCAKTKVCNGDFSKIENRTCCLRECVESGGGSTTKYIGWGVIIVIVAGLIFFYFKMKKPKKVKPNLKKIATAPRVKGNLLR